MEAALCEQAGNNSFSRHHHTEPDCGKQDQEFLWQVAPDEATYPAAGDDGAAHHPGSARISQARRRCLPSAARRQTPLAHRDHQVPEALRATATTSAATTAGEAWKEGGSESCAGSCGKSWGCD